MATIRNLTFRSRDLGNDVSLMLCFTPPGPDLYTKQFPVAWKVTTLGAVGGSVMTAQYISTLSVCSAQVSGAGNTVIAGTYIPIGPGQMTTLQKSAGGYKWTPPETVGGISIRAKNGTDGPVGIGAGFITNEGTDLENMNTAVVYDSVGSGLAVNAEFQPILSAYIALDYRENQIVKSEIIGIDPLWKDNLLSLGGDTTIWIRKTPQGGYRADVVAGNVGDASVGRGLDLSFGATYTYHANLSFAYPSLVTRALQDVVRDLLQKGYNVKVVAEDGEKNAHVELVLPPGASCDQAEKALLGSIHIAQFPLPIAIKEHYGERLVWTAGNASSWEPVSPATIDWYVNRGQNATHGFPNVITGPSPVRIAVENGEAKAEANGTAIEDADSAGFLAATTKRVNGNTRIVKKKKSTVDIGDVSEASTA